MSKINKVFIDKAEDLDIVMPMHNLLEYSDNYSITSGVCRIIIEIEWMMLLIKMMLLIIESKTTRKEQINLKTKY